MRNGLSVTRLILVLAVMAISSEGLAASNVKLAVQEITDNRVSEGPYVGRLEVSLRLDGEELDAIDSARVLVTKASDDKGNDLLLEDRDPPDFAPAGNHLKISLENPARDARSISLSGTAELFVPSKDPGAVFTIENALTKLDTLVKAKTFTAEKMRITLVAPATHKKTKKQIGPEDIEDIQKQGKEEGVSEEEIEAAIEFAMAMQDAVGEVSDNVVILKGSEADIDRILSVRLLRPDGSEISVPSRSWSGTSKEKTLVLEPAETPPADTTLEFTVLTKNATASVPFELSGIELP